MKGASILAGVLLLAVVTVSCTGKRGFVYREPEMERGQSFKIYDRDWNLQAYVKEGSSADWYQIYDKDWRLKGYIKWNRLSERYEIYDRNWKRKGYLNGGLLPFLKEERR